MRVMKVTKMVRDNRSNTLPFEEKKIDFDPAQHIDTLYMHAEVI